MVQYWVKIAIWRAHLWSLAEGPGWRRRPRADGRPPCRSPASPSPTPARPLWPQTSSPSASGKSRSPAGWLPAAHLRARDDGQWGTTWQT